MDYTMSIKDYLAGAKQAGSVQKLMTPGLAVEFIQPWYTPLCDAGRAGSHRKAF